MGWDVAQCIKKPRGIAKHYDYDFYLERIPVEPQDYEKQNRELSLKALEFLEYNFDFDVIFYSFGKQLMPILLGMRQFSVQKHVFITSISKNAKALKRFFEERKETNENFQINTDRLHSIEVNVFEPKNIYENILEYTKKHGLKDKRLCFNLTGGTKMMFLAGLKASECFQTPYFYIEEKAQRLLFFKNPSDIEPFIIPAIPIKDVETFFSLHVPNRRIKQNGIIDEKSLEKIQERKNLSSLLYEHRARIIPLYKRINENHAKDKTINIFENNLKLFYKDHQVCVNIDGKEIKLRYSEDEDDFRKYIIYTELDIAFSDGKNLYIAECKSGGLKNKGVLTALSTNAQIFGGANAKCILISIDGNLGKGIQEKVKILNIKFIFKDFKKILKIISMFLGVDKSRRGCLAG